MQNGSLSETSSYVTSCQITKSPVEGRTMKIFTKIAILLFLSCLFTSEVYAFFGREKIIDYNYDKNVRGYRLFFKKKKMLNELILREEDGKKVLNEERVKELVDKFNQKKFALDNYIEKNVKDISETAKYEAGKSYYVGLKLQKELKFVEAIDSYEKALESNEYLKYQSDIYFRFGQCYQYLNNNDKAIESYETFLLYSERVIPFSFYQNKDFEDNLKDLFERAEANIILVEEDKKNEEKEVDISPHTDEEIPSIYRYGAYPGFTLGKQGKGLISIGAGYSSIDGIGGSVEFRKGVTDSVDLGLGMYYFEDQKIYLAYMPLSIYQAPDNRFGIKVTPRFSLHNFSDIDFDATILGINLSSTYFLTPQISAFCGISAPLYYGDNSTHYELISTWKKTYAYGGINFHEILGEIGFSVFSYNNELHIEMLGTKGIRVIGQNLFTHEVYIGIEAPLIF